jgi:hypothetical protein
MMINSSRRLRIHRQSLKFYSIIKCCKFYKMRYQLSNPTMLILYVIHSLRVLDIALRRDGAERGREWVHKAMQTFAKQFGNAQQAYNHTTVEFWINAVAMTQNGVSLLSSSDINKNLNLPWITTPRARAEAFAEALPRSLLDRYYSQRSLLSEQSFHQAVAPDLARFPVVA